MPTADRTSFLSALAAFVALPTLVAGFVPLLILAAVLHLRVVIFEERRLERSFPEDRPRYSGAAKRWWPRVRPWRG